MNNTIRFFREIAQIPRESGNEEGIANYLVQFAQKRNLYWYKDQYNNVLIKKENKDLPCLILQAHTDMVCVSKDPLFDFSIEPIEVVEKNGYLYANNTTLGADNGIGVAQILNILDSNLPCNIEAIFTTSEETSMIGADRFDMSLLKGNYLLNLDGFDENTILTESAAYYDLVMKSSFFEKIRTNKEYTYLIHLTGLMGGHSGYDINKNRGNAILLMAEFLKMLDGDLISISSGTKNNVFPSQAEAVINTNLNDLDLVVTTFLDKYRSLYIELKINYQKAENSPMCFSNTNKFLDFLVYFPSKAINYTEDGNVTTSLNLGVIKNCYLEIGLRSSRKEEALKLLKDLEEYAYKFSFELIQEGFQPGFYSDIHSDLIQILYDTCPYSTEPNITLAHITTEVGFFQEKKPDLQVAIISPRILNAHSTQECVELHSVSLVDEWLVRFIQQFNKL